jgi:hypothetical protein
LGGVGISSSQQLPRRLPKPVWEPYSAGLPINVLPPSRPLETKKAMSSNH